MPAPAPGSLRHLTLRVWRQDPGAPGGLAEYRIAAPAEGMVLDALFAIQVELDSTLAFRVACRAGMCGSCAVRVDGRERLACQTPLALVGDTVRVEPLRHLQVFKDLVVDLEPFFEKYGRIHPEFRPAPGRRDAVTPAEHALVDRAINCISCGACHSACDVVGLNSDFLGPAALARAWALVGDRRDRDGRARLRDATGENGVWRCHDIGVCTTVCPKAVAPTLAVQALRRRALWKS